MRILLTRPAAQSRAFAKQLTDRFGSYIDIFESPLLRIEMLTPSIAFDQYDAVVFTSQNGVEAYKHLKGPAGMTAYCVGDRTAAVAKNAGLNAVSADGDVKAISALVEREAGGQRLLHLTGAHVAGTVAGDVTRIVAYRQKPVPLSRSALEALHASHEIALPLFSPRTAQLFQAGLPDKVSAPLRAFCLSPAVAAELDRSSYTQVQVCDRPKAVAMIQCLAGVLKL